MSAEVTQELEELYERTLKEMPPYPVNPIHQSLRSAYSMVLDTVVYVIVNQVQYSNL